MGIWN